MTAKEIRSAVARKHGLEPCQLLKGNPNGGKSAVIVQARAEAMAAVRRELRYSLPLIGRVFGGYHHSSVLHLISKIPQGAIKYERKTVQARLADLEAKVTELWAAHVRRADS